MPEPHCAPPCTNGTQNGAKISERAVPRRLMRATAIGKPDERPEQEERLGPPEARAEHRAEAGPEAGCDSGCRRVLGIDVEQRSRDLGLDRPEPAGHRGQADQHRDHQWRDDQAQGQAPDGDEGHKPDHPERQPQEQVDQAAIRRRIGQCGSYQRHRTPSLLHCALGGNGGHWPCRTPGNWCDYALAEPASAS